MKCNLPRFVVAGLSGDSGKTLISVGITSALLEKGFKVSCFKKGPDYIDAFWLGKASQAPAHNLDTFIMDYKYILSSFCLNSPPNGISIIEGNRGIFDGLDSEGLHSTAELAKILNSPVILAVNAIKMTRTIAAIVWGVKNLDLGLQIAGVIINNFVGDRHKKVIQQSIEDIAKVKVIGAIPRLDDFSLLPSRHLGLITPQEYDKTSLAIQSAKEIILRYVDVEEIIRISLNAEPIECLEHNEITIQSYFSEIVKIGYFYDEAFSFYYPDNLESLKRNGAELIQVSPIHDSNLPDIDGIYIGGGFPEIYAEKLSANKSFISQFREIIIQGLPCFAECGGLMYLAERIYLEQSYQFSGILPISISFSNKPAGHGYFEAIVDKQNPYFELNEIIRGHEFHYSWISEIKSNVETALKVVRGVGAIENRDGFVYKNVFASYVHIHNASYPNWAKRFVELVRKNKNISKYKNAVGN